MKGTILRSAGGMYEVGTQTEVVPAVLRGRLKTEARVGDRVVVGDRVELAAPEREGDPWTIETVADRTSALVRRAPGKAPRPKVIVANVDRVVIVFSIENPEPHLRMLDRFLAIAEHNDLEAVIVANKVDLDSQDRAEALFGTYREIGYRVIYSSAVSGLGIDHIREVLCGDISALTGPSGVGKSSLLNRVQPGLGLRVAEVSRAVKKGRHTTVTAELIQLDCGGYVADTPGLREVGLWDVDDEELDQCFLEFLPHLGGCRYGYSCSHSHEPGCAVAAVVGSDISRDRYDSYLRILSGEDERGG